MLKLSKDILEIISAISEVLDMEGDDLLYHGLRVAHIARYLAKELGSDEEELFISGLIHDFGSFDLPSHILHYYDLSSQISDKQVASHPIVGAQIILTIPSLTSLARIVLLHHERFDGKGYPLGWKDGEIIKESQILRIADSLGFKYHWEKELRKDEIIKYLEEESNKEFCSDYLEGIKSVIEKEDFLKVMGNDETLKESTYNYIERIASRRSSFREIEKILNFFGRLLDAKHSYTEGHSLRVAEYSSLIALALGGNSHLLERVRIAGLLHDIGKLGIPKDILDKPAILTDEEFDIIKRHPFLGVKIIKKISFFKWLIPILESDQEHWDGSGYPSGLKGEEIPLEARIVLIADAFDAMTSDRAYRKAMKLEEALLELKRCAGKDFDPKIVELALPLLRRVIVYG